MVTLKLNSAVFDLSDRTGSYQVVFQGDQVVVMLPGGTHHLVDNPTGDWRPCATVARRLIKLATGSRPGRQLDPKPKADRPMLRLHVGE